MYDGFEEMEHVRKQLTGFILVIEPVKKISFISKLKKVLKWR